MNRESLVTAAVLALAIAIMSPPSASGAIVHSVDMQDSMYDLAPVIVSNDLLQTNLSGSSIENFTPVGYDPTLPDGGNLFDGSPNIAMDHRGGTPYIDGNYTVPWTATFALDTTVHTQGYKLTAINVFSGWYSGLASQNFTIEVSLVGSSDFTSLGTFAQTASDVGVVTHVYEDASGVLASGVDAIRFTHNSSAGDGRGSVREVDVIGSPVPEPATLALLSVGGLLIAKRRR